MQNTKHKFQHNRFPKELYFSIIGERIVLLDEFVYLDSHLGVLRIPKGFDTLYIKDKDILLITIIKDYCYKTQTYSRNEVNKMLSRLISKLEISFINSILYKTLFWVYGIYEWYTTDEKVLIKYRHMGRK